MKILWLCNVMADPISEHLNYAISEGGGWITALFNEFIKHKDVELAVCAPNSRAKKFQCYILDGVKYYNFIKKYWEPTVYDSSVENQFKRVLNDFKPDIVHIFGTEYPHSLSMVKIFNNPQKTIVNLQGLTSVIAKHYFSNLPYKIIKQYTFRDFVKQDNIIKQAKKFEIRGKYEKIVLKRVKHVIGRTDWDRACSLQINDKLNYFHCNEVLRENFYNGKWKLEDCERYSMFISQGSYPIKGLHVAIEALSRLKKNFSGVHLYVSGNPMEITSLENRVRSSSYLIYIKRLIKKFNLEQHITFLGNIDKEEMYKRFLKSHVFVSSSFIENESNSLSEAKILGVPVVASFSGGVTSRIRHKIDGFLYQADAPYMLEYYISEIFLNDFLAKNLSENARIEAQNVNSKEKNYQNMIKVYHHVYKGVKNGAKRFN